ncbi:hypothetical protein NM208_g3177 [Fusarium decemcellulare]|uniref:Uncharacterized protein n=1 Tax=Fusarium decemcellulare TaxID=57161 RepID=A0ACC1SQ60_9HYPO|nr:hypothetical protein NM208_g3177 [Fusarium decemcellulare]
MKYTIVLSLAAALPLAMGEIMPRACKPTSCSCQGVPNGLFCGDGILGCVKGHVYQCGDDGKKSCDFGPRDSCKKCGELQC